MSLYKNYNRIRVYKNSDHIEELMFKQADPKNDLFEIGRALDGLIKNKSVLSIDNKFFISANSNAVGLQYRRTATS